MLWYMLSSKMIPSELRLYVDRGAATEGRYYHGRDSAI